MFEDSSHFFEPLGFMPEFFSGVAETFNFYVLHFIHCVFFLLSPFEFFIEEVENHKVQTPQVVSSGQVLKLIQMNYTMLLWALREAKETVPLKSAFFR